MFVFRMIDLIKDQIDFMIDGDVQLKISIVCLDFIGENKKIQFHFIFLANVKVSQQPLTDIVRSACTTQ